MALYAVDLRVIQPVTQQYNVSQSTLIVLNSRSNQKGGNHATHCMGVSKPTHGYSKWGPTKRGTSHRCGIRSSSHASRRGSKIEPQDIGLLRSDEKNDAHR